MKLYSEFRISDEGIKDNAGSVDSEKSSNRNMKQAKLFHRTFILRLILRFGLKSFLDNFVTPLVEAVGGYHETNHRPNSAFNDKGARLNCRKNLSTSSHLK